MLVHFMTILSILRPFGIFCGHLVILWSFGIIFLVLVFLLRKIWQLFLGYSKAFEGDNVHAHHLVRVSVHIVIVVVVVIVIVVVIVVVVIDRADQVDDRVEDGHDEGEEGKLGIGVSAGQCMRVHGPCVHTVYR
jgi:heme/copper-type cytochrome/quinol oxidase subunit 2